MVQPTIKKHQRPAALKKRIDKIKAQLQELEDMLAAAPASPTEGGNAQLPATPPEGDQIPEENVPTTPPAGPAMPA